MKITLLGAVEPVLELSFPLYEFISISGPSAQVLNKIEYVSMEIAAYLRAVEMTWGTREK